MLFLAGALSILVQVVLLRELAAAFYGIDLIYVLALGAWLLWTAVGAVVCGRTRSPASWRVVIVLLAVGIVVPLDLLLIRRLRVLLGSVPGAFLPLPAQLLGSVLCLMPSSVLLGLLFQWSAKRALARHAGATTSQAYAMESAGAVAGGLLTTYAVWAGVQNFTLAIAASALAIGTPVLMRTAPTPLRTLARGLLVACAVAAWLAPSVDMWTTRWNYPDVVQMLDSAYGRITVTKRAGQVSVYENDALSFESEGTDAEEFVHVSLAQHPTPRRVLLIDGARADLIRFVAEHHPEVIDDIDLNRRMVGAMERWMPPAYARSLRAAGVRLQFDDPRRAVALWPTASCLYDAIVVAAAEPSSAQANRFFTREFFSDCAARLAPGGVLALRLPSVENAWTPQLLARTASIHSALRALFTDIVVLPGSSSVILASMTPLLRDGAVQGARMADRAIPARLVTPRYLRYLYSNDRNAEIQAMLRKANAEPNTDANPASYQATALVWLSKFVPAAAHVDLRAVAHTLGWRSWTSWFVLAVFGVISAGTARRDGRGRLGTVATAAFAGMVIESVLVVHYQLKQGVVFQALGLLLTSVMLGLAAGACVAHRMKARTGATVALLGLAALALVASACIRTGLGSGLPLVAALLVGTGAAVGVVFGCAAMMVPDQQSVVSPVYAADVVGGSVGSLAASFVLIPLLGLPVAAEWAAAITACTAAAVGWWGKWGR